MVCIDPEYSALPGLPEQRRKRQPRQSRLNLPGLVPEKQGVTFGLIELAVSLGDKISNLDVPLARHSPTLRSSDICLREYVDFPASEKSRQLDSELFLFCFIFIFGLVESC